MAKTNLSGAQYVQHGYGQVEPNHLSAQRTAQIYAQLPADANINVLQNGQFVKYDYANGVVNFTGVGEWMLVFNEVKLYRDHEQYDDFAMKKEDYVARVYSPIDGENPTYANSRNYNGVVNAYEHDITSTTNPFVIEQFKAPDLMPTGTKMVPRVLKTNVGDIFTTNLVDETTLAAGNILVVSDTGILVKESGSASSNTVVNKGTMKWQVVKVYTLADRQKAVKIMRIA